MAHINEAIRELEEKLDNLVSNYEFLKEENEVLLQSKNQIQHQLLEKEQLVEEQEKQLKLLRIAKTIEGSSEYKRDTKLKINALIREIDKCIRAVYVNCAG